MNTTTKEQWKLIIQCYGTDYKEEQLYDKKKKALNDYYLLEQDCCIERCYLFDPKGNLFYE